MTHLEPRPEDLTRSTQVHVDLDAISHNYRQFCSHVGSAKVMPVIKADAYGHGLVQVARHLSHLAPPYFGVATFEEALTLRDAGVTTEILVFGGMDDRQIPLYIENQLTLTASSVSKFRAIDSAAEVLGVQAKVHLKIDTGMERVGVHHYNADQLLQVAVDGKSVAVTGIYTHFATADDGDQAFMLLQLQRFEQICNTARPLFSATLLCHAANSAATLTLPASHMDMVRVGIALYGVLPKFDLQQPLTLHPALSWQSKVVYFKVVRAGNAVSYGCSWRPEQDTRVVTVPVGYADGYARALSNRAQVFINSKHYPVVGAICMDQLMVDIGQDSVFNGDKVELIGAHIDAHQLAQWRATIAYEVITGIGQRVPRAYLHTSTTN